MEVLKKARKIFIGEARELDKKETFKHISLVAFFAWVGLGSDGLSSSCYGPEEIYRNLGGHSSIAIYVGLMTIITILVISTSYSQIIKLFPHGGGGYIVASRLLSPMTGMISGSALLIDYVLTITLSISSGADAIFSFFPLSYLDYKLVFAIIILFILVLLNLRGVRESVMTLTPIFVLFVLTHIILITYAIIVHVPETATIASNNIADMKSTISQLGVFGMLALLMKSYSMGAGTYTGIEAVSNGIPNLREPRVQTALKTMRYLAASLGVAAFGLIIAYYLCKIHLSPGKTANAVLISTLTGHWNYYLATSFAFLTLLSEAALLFVAAQTGFLDGPRVMANMAHDYWFPRRFTSLSDRLVSQNGIMLMGGAALIVLYLSKGNVSFLVILYSINVFITFSLSQLGMVRHWFSERKKDKKWLGKLLINGIGLVLTTFILITVTVVKFGEGGWLTLLITGVVVILAILIKNHYNSVGKKIISTQRMLNPKMSRIINALKVNNKEKTDIVVDKNAPTAVLLINGYTGIGLYSFFNFISSFHNAYKNIIFLQVGLVDTHNSKSLEYIEKTNEAITTDLNKYVYLANLLGFNAEYRNSVGTDIVEEIEKLTPAIIREYPNIVFVGGQLIFKGTYRIVKLLHNYTIFEIQRKLYQMGITTIVIPVSLDDTEPLIKKIEDSADNKWYPQTIS